MKRTVKTGLQVLVVLALAVIVPMLSLTSCGGKERKTVAPMEPSLGIYKDTKGPIVGNEFRLKKPGVAGPIGPSLDTFGGGKGAIKGIHLGGKPGRSGAAALPGSVPSLDEEIWVIARPSEEAPPAPEFGPPLWVRKQKKRSASRSK